MKTRGTLILFVVAAGLVAFILYYALDRPGTRESVIEAAHAANLDVADIRGIRVRQGNREMVFRRSGPDDRLRLVEPIEDRVGLEQQSVLLATLGTIPRSDVIVGASKEEWREFGLSPAKMRVELEGDGDLPTYLIGRETALPGKVYFAIEGGTAIHVVPQSVRDVVNQAPDDYRDRILTDLDPRFIDKLVIGTRPGQIELARRQGTWRIDRPVNARAEDAAVEHILRAVTGARIEGFVDPAEATLAGMGLADPLAVVSLYPMGSDTPRSVQIGGPVPAPPPGDPDAPGEEPAELIYIRYPERDAIFQVEAGLAGLADLTPNALRDTTLADIPLDAVDRVRIEPVGKPAILLVRDAESWRLAEPIRGPANAERIMELLERVNRQTVAGFVSDTAADLAPYGLDEPWVRLTVSSYVSENIPHGGAGAHPLAEIEVGAYDLATGGFFARLRSEPFIVAIPADLAGDIATSAALWQSLSVFGGDASSITRIRLARGGLSGDFERSGDGWVRADGGPPVGPAAVASCANTLANLHAVRRTDQPVDPLLADPLLRIDFTRDGQESWLVLGPENAEGFFAAAARDDAGVFLVSRPDFNALNLPLGPSDGPAPPSQDVAGDAPPQPGP